MSRKEENFQTNKEVTLARFLQREYNVTHLTYEKEFRFYHAVKDGNEEEVQKIMLPLSNEKLGVLSKNPVRNLRYHLIISIAMITRFCIEGGMTPEDAYTISDIYIRKADESDTAEAINRLHEQVIFDFTRRMKKVRKATLLSRPVIQVIDYVYDHLHEKISLDEVAAQLQLSKSYLCDLFKKETGITILQFIHKRRIEAAQNMLAYSDYSYIEISNYLCFSSHSHFIKLFKEETGMTPKEYREFHYRENFTLQNPAAKK